jgi:hypothetical protein
MRGLIAGLFLLTASFAPSAYAGGPPPGDLRRAEKLFEEGRAAIDRGDYATGCARFAESVKLAERAGSLLNLAECAERDGKPLAGSRYAERALVVLDAKDPRAAFARDLHEKLLRRVARLQLTLSPELAAAAIQLDGEPIARSALSAPILVEPGAHDVTGDGLEPVHINLQSGDSKSVALSARVAPVTATPAKADGSSPDSLPSRRTLAWISLGGAAAGLLIGVVTSGVLLSNKSDVDAHCPNKLCDPEGRRLIDAQSGLIAVNAVGFGAGLALAGLGTVLYFTSGKTESSRIQAVAIPVYKGGIVSAQGRF